METPATVGGRPSDPFPTGAAVAVAAPDGALTGWSAGAEQLLGYSAAEAVAAPRQISSRPLSPSPRASGSPGSRAGSGLCSCVTATAARPHADCG